MTEISSQTKNTLKKALFFSGLFLALTVLFFYLVNLDLSPAPKRPAALKKPVQKVEIKNEEVKKRTVSSELGFSEFEDWAAANGLAAENVYEADPDEDGLSNFLEYVHMTDPNASDTDGDDYLDGEEIANGYDPDDTGNTRLIAFLNIEKIKAEAPLVWSESEDDKAMLKDLESGVSHYPGSATPGSAGNMIISGHSSNYFWAAGEYNHIFKDLNNLEAGDIVTVRTIQKNGRVITYTYKVTDKFTTAPDDERIFEENAGATLTLSTCWPPGTTFRRVIVKAELVK